MLSLEEKTAFVTGGARGIGAAIVRALYAEGANVAFTYQHSVAQAEQLASDLTRPEGNAPPSDPTSSVIPMRVDSLDAAALQQAMIGVKERWGRFDILVNNAGVFDARPLESFTLDDYDQQMGTNARAVFAATQTAAMLMNDGGRIVNVGSNLADRVPSAGLSLYTMSKAAITGLTKAAARELGHRGITVNIVHPGSTDTDMNSSEGPHASQQRSLRVIPDFSRPEEIASLVVYLCGYQARAITGAGFLIDGGANL